MTKDDDKKGKQLSIEPKKSDKYYDEKGDLEIVSSDGVLFKIHAFYLQSSSSVFRDMISVGQEKVLNEVFNTLIDGGGIYDVPTHKVQNVIQFLRKYDFKSTLELAQAQLWKALYRNTEGKVPWHVFFRATHLDAHELCCKIIANHHTAVWQGTKDGVVVEEFGEGTVGKYAFDPSAMCQYWHDLLPKDAAWALLRASCKATFSKPPTGMNAMGDEYMRLMKLRDAAKAPKSAKPAEA